MEEDYLEQLVMENTSLSSQMREYLYTEMSHGVKVSNTLHFFHDQNIIKTFFSFSCKANILLPGAAGISFRVFLTVHIIRLISILRSKG